MLCDYIYLHQALPKFRFTFDPLLATFLFAGIEILLDNPQMAFAFITIGCLEYVIVRRIIIWNPICDEYRTKEEDQEETSDEVSDEASAESDEEESAD